jgi:nitroreductase
VREFKSDAVPEQVVRRAIEAGLRAPCNAHLKSWQFLLLRDREKRLTAVAEKLRARDMKEPGAIERIHAKIGDEELKRVYRRSLPVQLTMLLEAPEVLVVCYRMKALSECRTLFELNPLASVWMCIENVMLALAADGVCGCTYTPYDAEGLKSFLGVPTGFEVAAVIPFGYPAAEPLDATDEDVDVRIHVDSW